MDRPGTTSESLARKSAMSGSANKTRSSGHVPEPADTPDTSYNGSSKKSAAPRQTNTNDSDNDPDGASSDADDATPSASATASTPAGTDEAFMMEELGISPDDPMGLERVIFTAINAGDRETLLKVFDFHPSPIAVTRMLLMTAYPNKDGFYHHDQDVIHDAHELLGPSLDNLNALQIACILGDEEIALDILNFVDQVTIQCEVRKVLFEFMGRVWGNGNTVLHLASFLGMSDLVKRLLELGAAAGKVNERKYKPVDCADDDLTRSMFENVTELKQIKSSTLDSGNSQSFEAGSMKSISSVDLASMATSPSSAKGLSTPFSPTSASSDATQGVLPSSPLAIKPIGPQGSSPRETRSMSVGASASSSLQPPDDATPPQRGHAKSQSWDSGQRSRSGSGSTTGSTTGTTAASASDSPRDSRPRRLTKTGSSNSDFRVGELSREPSSIDGKTDAELSSRQPASLKPGAQQPGVSIQPSKQKPKKSVRFDRPTMVLHLCQHADDDDDGSQPSRLVRLRQLLQLDTTAFTTRINVNSILSAQQGLTPLHVACSHGAEDIVEMLLSEAHAAVNVQDREGWTPLHCAAAEGHLGVLRLLGRCQGRYDENNTAGGDAQADWFYTVDGPIDLIPLTDENETPEDVALEDSADEIYAIFQDLKTRYPPPAREIQYDEDGEDVDADGELEDSSDEEDDDDDEGGDAVDGKGMQRQKESSPIRGKSPSFDKMAAGLSHMPSVMIKTSQRRKEQEDNSTSVTGSLESITGGGSAAATSAGGGGSGGGSIERRSHGHGHGSRGNPDRRSDSNSSSPVSPVSPVSPASLQPSLPVSGTRPAAAVAETKPDVEPPAKGLEPAATQAAPKALTDASTAKPSQTDAIAQVNPKPAASEAAKPATPPAANVQPTKPRSISDASKGALASFGSPRPIDDDFRPASPQPSQTSHLEKTVPTTAPAPTPVTETASKPVTLAAAPTPAPVVVAAKVEPSRPAATTMPASTQNPGAPSVARLKEIFNQAQGSAVSPESGSINTNGNRRSSSSSHGSQGSLSSPLSGSATSLSQLAVSGVPAATVTLASRTLGQKPSDEDQRALSSSASSLASTQIQNVPLRPKAPVLAINARMSPISIAIRQEQDTVSPSKQTHPHGSITSSTRSSAVSPSASSALTAVPSTIDASPTRRSRLRGASISRPNNSVESAPRDFAWMKQQQPPPSADLDSDRFMAVKTSGEYLKRGSELSRRVSKSSRDPDPLHKPGLNRWPSYTTHGDAAADNSSGGVDTGSVGTVDSIRRAFNNGDASANRASSAASSRSSLAASHEDSLSSSMPAAMFGSEQLSVASATSSASNLSVRPHHTSRRLGSFVGQTTDHNRRPVPPPTTAPNTTHGRSTRGYVPASQSTSDSAQPGRSRVADTDTVSRDPVFPDSQDRIAKTATVRDRIKRYEPADPAAAASTSPQPVLTSVTQGSVPSPPSTLTRPGKRT